MVRPSVRLMQVPTEYVDVIRRAAYRRGLAVVSSDGYPPASGFVGFCALCVLGADDDSAAVARHIQALRESLGACPIVVIGKHLGVEAAVRFMRCGATDVVALSAGASNLGERVLECARSTYELSSSGGLVGSSPAIERVRKRMTAVARTGSTVLLRGETGCGKGVVAREIHRLSVRRNRPFIHVDCAALATSVIDSELFGHERGAFTGAVGRRAGRFERAEGGTIFLDEIGDLEAALQSKLLRVLQDREYERLGGSSTRPMTARVIAATNRDLREEVGQGRFRADLLFRINVFEIAIAPVRERRSDIPKLVPVLLARLSKVLQIPAPTFSDGFTRRLMCHDWPGNVRELMNLLERLMIERGGGSLDESAVDSLLDGAEATAFSAHSIPWSGTIASRKPGESDGREREAIVAALRAERGNVTRTARRLGIARSTLRYRMRQHGL